MTRRIVGKKILRTRKQREGTNEKHIIFFGASNFSGGGHGHVSIPRKKLVRILSQHVPVVLTNEYCTSKHCPLCLRELNDIKCDKEDPTTIQRFRQCKTETIESSEFRCPFSKEKMIDRDDGGSTNITQKGLFDLASKRGIVSTRLECFYHS
jgi:hypothetical protein